MDHDGRLFEGSDACTASTSVTGPLTGEYNPDTGHFEGTVTATYVEAPVSGCADRGSSFFGTTEWVMPWEGQYASGAGAATSKILAEEGGSAFMTFEAQRTP